LSVSGVGPRPGEGAHVIDYGHGQQRDEPRDEGSRHLRCVSSLRSDSVSMSGCLWRFHRW